PEVAGTGDAGAVVDEGVGFGAGVPLLHAAATSAISAGATVRASAVRVRALRPCERVSIRLLLPTQVHPGGGGDGGALPGGRNGVRGTGRAGIQAAVSRGGSCAPGRPLRRTGPR